MFHNIAAPFAVILFCLATTAPLITAQDDLAGSFLSGLLDTITSTADSKDCPGVCVHTLATLICYEVLNDVPCPSPSMKCCIETAPGKNVTKAQATSAATTTTAATSRRPPTSTHKPIVSKTPSPSTTSTSTTSKKPPTTKKTTRAPTTIANSATKNATDSAKDNCIGVCVADRIAEYCEAYLTSNDLCKEGTKCCVSLDEYPNGKLPKDIYIPAKHMTNLNHNNNHNKGASSRNKTTSATKPVISTKHAVTTHTETTKVKTTTTTTTGPATAEPAKTKTNNNHHGTANHNKPAKQKKTQSTTTTTTTASTNNVSGEEESELEDDDSHNNEPAGEKEEVSNDQTLKECEGECMNGIIAIFCDDIDSDAYCPGEGSCCVTGNAQVEPTQPVKPATKIQNKPAPKPVHKITPPPTTPAPAPNVGSDIFQSILNFAENTLSGATNTPPAPSTTPPTQAPVQYPRCPGFCLHAIMVAFCERPSILINTPTTCTSNNLLCCDNSRAGPPKKPPTAQQTRRPPPATTTFATQPSTSQPYVIPNTPLPDLREECPGSCIVSLLSFTCFKNAEMTDLFKCKRSGQVCCAPKSKILEKQQFQMRNDTSYLNYPRPIAPALPQPPPPPHTITPQQTYAHLPPPPPYMPPQPQPVQHLYQQVPALKPQPTYADYPHYGPSGLGI